MSATWEACDRACDPHATGARRDGAWHYSDCPIWDYLKVDPRAVFTQGQIQSVRPDGGEPDGT